MRLRITLVTATMLAASAAILGQAAPGYAIAPGPAGIAPDVLPVGGAVPAVAVDSQAGLVWAAVTTGASSDSVTEFSEASQSVTATFTVPAAVDGIAVDERSGIVWASSAGTGKSARQVLTEINAGTSAVTSVDLTAASDGGHLLGVVTDPNSAAAFALTSNGRLIEVPEADPARFSVVAGTTVAEPGALAIDPADGRIWVTSLASRTVTAFTEAGAPAPGVPAAIRVGAGPGAIAVDPDAGLVWVGNLDAGTLTEIRESDGTVLARAISVGTGLAAVAVAPDQAHPAKGIVWTAGSFLPFTFDEFSEARTPGGPAASGPADVAGLPEAIAADPANGQLYEGTSEGLSPFLPTQPVLNQTEFFWWTNFPSANTGPASTTISFPPPVFAMSGAPSWLRLDPITGILRGQPKKPGKFSFTVTASDTLGLRSSAAFTISVGIAPVFTSPGSATFIAGLTSRFHMVATGKPKPTLALGGPDLPSGLAFTSSGLLSGIPAAGTEGTYLFFAGATNDPTDAITVIQQFTLRIVRGRAPRFTAPDKTRIKLRPGHRAVVRIKASGVPVAKITSGGKLPRGLSFHPMRAGGQAVISGVPAQLSRRAHLPRQGEGLQPGGPRDGDAGDRDQLTTGSS